MSTVFAGTAFYIALIRPSDSLHQRAREFDRSFRGVYLTTDYVLIELGNWLADAHNRPVYVTLVEALRSEPRVRVVPSSARLFERGMKLYRERPDKEWSLTDCISFVVMRDERIAEALTGDHHFEQAGFAALLK